MTSEGGKAMELCDCGCGKPAEITIVAGQQAKEITTKNQTEVEEREIRKATGLFLDYSNTGMKFAKNPTCIERYFLDEQSEPLKKRIGKAILLGVENLEDILAYRHLDLLDIKKYGLVKEIEKAYPDSRLSEKVTDKQIEIIQKMKYDFKKNTFLSSEGVYYLEEDMEFIHRFLQKCNLPIPKIARAVSYGGADYHGMIDGNISIIGRDEEPPRSKYLVPDLSKAYKKNRASRSKEQTLVYLLTELNYMYRELYRYGDMSKNEYGDMSERETFVSKIKDYCDEMLSQPFHMCNAKFLPIEWEHEYLPYSWQTEEYLKSYKKYDPYNNDDWRDWSKPENYKEDEKDSTYKKRAIEVFRELDTKTYEKNLEIHEEYNANKYKTILCLDEKYEKLMQEEFGPKYFNDKYRRELRNTRYLFHKHADKVLSVDDLYNYVTNKDHDSVKMVVNMIGYDIKDREKYELVYPENFKKEVAEFSKSFSKSANSKEKSKKELSDRSGIEV